jgi:hypothetical protein
MMFPVRAIAGSPTQDVPIWCEKKVGEPSLFQ